MRVTLVRHGAVEERYLGCYNGHIDIVLSQEGKEQSARLGKLLMDEDFDAIYSSDLRRTKETLTIMQEQFVASLEPIYTKALREKSWGRHEGMDFASIVAQDSLTYHSFLEWIEALDGERLEAFVERVANFFHELAKCGKKNILIVTHAGVIATLRSLTETISLEEAFMNNIGYAEHVVFSF
jgi:broad specificity phosphatase PhoE